MNHESPKTPSGTLPDTPPISSPEDETPPIKEPLVTVTGSLPEYDVDTLKVEILGCFPPFPQLPKGPTAWGSFRIDPMNRFPSAPRTLSEPHLWPPRPSCINTIEHLAQNMKTVILPEIQLPVDCFRVLLDGTLFIEKGFGKDIIKNLLMGRYNKSKLSFGEHVQRVKKAFKIRGRERKEPERYTIRAKTEEEKLQNALARWEAPKSAKRPKLPVVDSPRRTWIYHKNRRVFLDKIHFAELHIPESIVNGDDVDLSDEGIMIRATTGRKILENATLFVPEDEPLLKDFDTLTAISTWNDGKERAGGESTTIAVDIVKYHLSHGGWMWIYHTTRLQDPDINIALTEDYEVARYYHVAKGGSYLIEKLCEGLSLTRNDRIFLRRFGIERIQCNTLLTYAKILCKMAEKQYEPELTDVRVAIPATAKIDCTRETRIMQTMKGEHISEPPPPVNLEPVPEAKKETPPGTPKESPKDTPRRLSQLFIKAAAPTLPASPPESPSKGPRPSSLFIQKHSKCSLNDSQETIKASRSISIATRILSSQETLKAPDKSCEPYGSSCSPESSELPNPPKHSERSTPSESSKPSKPSTPSSKRSKTSKSFPTYRVKKGLRKYKRRLDKALSLLTPPTVDYKGKGRELPEPKTPPKKNPVPKYGKPTPTPINIPYSTLYKPSSPTLSLHDSEKTQTPKESEYEPCPACTQTASGSEHKGKCLRPFTMKIEWSRYPDRNAMARRREDEEISRRLSSVRLRITVEKEVFVRVRGSSFSKVGGGGGSGAERVGQRRYSVSELEGRRFRPGLRGEGVTTVFCEPPKRASNVGSTKKPRFSGIGLRKSHSNSNPNREAVATKRQTLTAKLLSPRAAPTSQVPRTKTKTLPAPLTSTTTASIQVPKPAVPKDSRQTTANNSAGTTPPLTRLPSSSSSMDFDSEGFVEGKEGTLNSLEDLGVFVEGSGLD